MPNGNYYNPVVVLHTRDIKNRVLSFGVSRRAVGGEVDVCLHEDCDDPTDPVWWPVDDDVYEFVLNYAAADPIGAGEWESKAPMCSPRVFHTATVLPTGQIFSNRSGTDRRRTCGPAHEHLDAVAADGSPTGLTDSP